MLRVTFYKKFKPAPRPLKPIQALGPGLCLCSTGIKAKQWVSPHIQRPEDTRPLTSKKTFAKLQSQEKLEQRLPLACLARCMLRCHLPWQDPTTLPDYALGSTQQGATQDFPPFMPEPSWAAPFPNHALKANNLSPLRCIFMVVVQKDLATTSL